MQALAQIPQASQVSSFSSRQAVPCAGPTLPRRSARQQARRMQLYGGPVLSPGTQNLATPVRNGKTVLSLPAAHPACLSHNLIQCDNLMCSPCTQSSCGRSRHKPSRSPPPRLERVSPTGCPCACPRSCPRVSGT